MRRAGLLVIGIFGVLARAGIAFAAPWTGSADPSLDAFVRAEGRTSAEIVKVAVPSGTAAGATRALALAGEWERPPLLAVELGGRWHSRALAKGAEVRWLELRDVTGDGEPELLVRVESEERRVDHTTKVVRLAVWKLGVSGFAAAPIFWLPERVDEVVSAERSSHPSAQLAFEVRFEPARKPPRPRGKPPAKTRPAALDVVVTLVVDHIDSEHPALVGPTGHRKPTAWAGRWFWNKDLGAFFRDPRSRAPRDGAPPAPGRS